MQYEQMDPTAQQRSTHDFCKRYHYHLVQFETTDGHTYEGIIDGVEDDGVYMLVPAGNMEREDQEKNERQFYGYGGYSPYGYGFPRRFRRFRRHFFPFFIFRRFFFPFFY